jgi:hypothetical protein
MTKLSTPGTGIDTDSVSKVCELLERLGEVFAAENVDYAFVDGANRFFICHRDHWHAVTLSDTTLLVRTVADLQQEISQVVYGDGHRCANPFAFK